MNQLGDTDRLLIRSRSVLLDALEALSDHRQAVILVGAHAVYLHTAGIKVALAEATKDSDLVLDVRQLGATPLIEAAMADGGFRRDDRTGQPGTWVSPEGVPVDLMVPEADAGGGGRRARGARIPPHHKHSTRRARGLEGVVVDNAWLTINALHPDDERSALIRVAGPAALIVAKTHKITERARYQPRRLMNKDAHDLYRLLQLDLADLVRGFQRLQIDDRSAVVTQEALDALRDLVALGSDSLIAQMAGQAEAAVGRPGLVAESVVGLADELLHALDEP